SPTALFPVAVGPRTATTTGFERSATGFSIDHRNQFDRVINRSRPSDADLQSLTATATGRTRRMPATEWPVQAAEIVSSTRRSARRFVVEERDREEGLVGRIFGRERLRRI